ncbi:MAG: (d)CMP kinase [Archaeoglobaceae archaeon]
MRVAISGPPGSGTTTAAKLLAERFNLKLVSAGEIFRKLAEQRGMTLEEFGKYAEQNPEVDILIDKTQKEIAEREDDIVVEGRLSGYFVRNADLRVYLYADAEVRYERIARREKKSLEAAREETRRREEVERKRYRKFYGVDPEDLRIYDLAINSAKFEPEEIVEIVARALELRLRRK